MALNLFDDCWQMNEWPELEPAPTELDEDPLLLPGTPLFHRAGPRCDVPVGELVL